ncbi:hypothetical protein AHF37_11436 [Paragonimus kellicotti]|nr:hypothetical protein AHF37_11436 [Paragonimus kellicotti]
MEWNEILMEVLKIFLISLLFSQTVTGILNNGTAKLKISWSFENPTLRSEQGLSFNRNSLEDVLSDLNFVFSMDSGELHS